MQDTTRLAHLDTNENADSNATRNGGTKRDLIYPNKRFLHYAHHENGALESLRDMGFQPMYTYDYTYDPVGNKLTQGSIHDDKDSQTYAYDSSGRLVDFGRGDTSGNTWPGLDTEQDWTLDGVGNWSQYETVDSSGSPDIDETRLDTTFNEYYSVGGTAQTHDDNGNLLGDGNQTYKWDALGRLREVYDDQSALIVTYSYDPGNRRIRKDLASGTDTDYYYGGWQVLEERNASTDDILRQFVDGPYIDEHLAMDANEDADTDATESTDSRYFYHTNSLFSVAALSDDNAAIVEAYQYDPYGKHVVITDGDSDGVVEFDSSDDRNAKAASDFGNPYMFTGRRFDDETGLQLNRHRYYDAKRGRWISRDPMNHGDLRELYRYCRNNPIGLLDSFGQEGYSIGEFPENFWKSIDWATGIVFKGGSLFKEGGRWTFKTVTGAGTMGAKLVWNGTKWVWESGKDAATWAGQKVGINPPDCNYCPVNDRKPRKDWIPKENVNGCGPFKEILGLDVGKVLVPDFGPNPPFNWGMFTKACNNHDAAYGTCNTSGSDAGAKKKADHDLRGNMRSACGRYYKKWYHWGESPLYLLCLAQSEIFMQAVGRGGYGAYCSAQEKACQKK